MRGSKYRSSALLLVLFAAFAALPSPRTRAAESSPSEPANSVSIQIAGLITTNAALLTPVSVAVGIHDTTIGDSTYLDYEPGAVTYGDIVIERPVSTTDNSWQQWMDDFHDRGTRKDVQLEYKRKADTLYTIVLTNGFPIAYSVAARPDGTVVQRLRIKYDFLQ